MARGRRTHGTTSRLQSGRSTRAQHRKVDRTLLFAAEKPSGVVVRSSHADKHPGNNEKNVDNDGHQERVEEAQVALPHTLSSPRAVVVHLQHTPGRQGAALHTFKEHHSPLRHSNHSHGNATFRAFAPRCTLLVVTSCNQPVSAPSSRHHHPCLRTAHVSCGAGVSVGR